MSKKGRKAALQKSAKAIYAKKAGRHDRGHSRPGRPDGGVSAIANSLKRRASRSKKKNKTKPSFTNEAASPEGHAVGAQTAGGAKAYNIPFTASDLILIVGDGRSGMVGRGW